MVDTTALEAELRAIAEAANQHTPWHAYQTMQHAEMFVVDGRGFLQDGIVCGPTYEKRNAEFIAAASPDRVLELLDALASVRTENENLRTTVEADIEYIDRADRRVTELEAKITKALAIGQQGRTFTAQGREAAMRRVLSTDSKDGN